MDFLMIIGIGIALALVIYLLFKFPKCKHEENTYYDAEGDKLPGDQTESCLLKFTDCGEPFVIPPGFQSDAHFQNYCLYGGGCKS